VGYNKKLSGIMLGENVMRGGKTLREYVSSVRAHETSTRQEESSLWGLPRNSNKGPSETIFWVQGVTELQ